MLQLALANEPQLIPCDYELAHDGVSYTIDTLKHFHTLHPQNE